MNRITAPIVEFLRESNNIEGEYDDKSLEDALSAWMWINDKKRLTKELILDAHQILMDTRTTITTNQKGVFRNGPVWVGEREGKPWMAIPELIDQFVYKVNQSLQKGIEFGPFTKEEVAKSHHVTYEDIHPFFDGNGRTGRIFYNWHRLRLGLPLHIIRVGKEQQSYYSWFK